MHSPRQQQLSHSFQSSFQRVFSLKHHDLEQEHLDALAAFKQRIHDANLQLPAAMLVNGDLDATLLRFLRARKWHIEPAFLMLQKSCQWRAQVGADTILEQPVDAALTETVRSCRPSSYIGFDKEHHPIFVERLGKLDGKRLEKAAAAGGADDVIIGYHLREMEFMAQVVFAEASAAAGHTVDRVVSIMDAAGLTLSALTGFAQRLFRLITSMDSDNYPECCDAIYIVNGGATFGAIWRLVSPFVDKGTRDKVHVVGGGKAAQKVLFDALGRGLVPSFLGGDLDYDVTRRQWLDKMDAAMAERHQHPKGPQPPVVVQAAANGHLSPRQLSGAHQGRQGSGSGAAGWFQRLSFSHSHGSPRASLSADGGVEGSATPLTTAPRLSSVATTVYYDPQEPPSPTGASPTSSGGGGAHAHADGDASPFASAVGSGAADSLSVGPPESRTRSQLSQASGFTTATVGQGIAGALGHGAGHAVLDEEVGPEGQQPRCSCKCTIM